ncbi:hypothetical protein C4577_03595 [Candidatus Parcubacteria bacterium]|nr:MAG: hypothetical protein C4577_03595 [Candidatus Parcubacteria bacterium]
MNTIRICLLDVDGVLANFEASAMKAMGITKEELYTKVPPGKWSMNEPFMSDDDFWKCIDAVPDFWETLPKYDDADDIVKVCQKYFGDQIIVVTTPPKNPLSYAGKAHWMKHNFPKLYRQTFIGPKKHMLGHPGAVLVDDYELNCSKFQETGGQIVLVPNRGNKHYELISDRVKYVDERLKELCS